MKQKRNIYLMCAISCLQGMVFYAPIATLYRQANGLSLSQIALIESFSFIVSLLMELPWGLLADRIGYRKTMIACCAFYFISKVIFWQAAGFGAFLLERVALSVALAGLSGVDTSILYLSCRDEESQKIFGYYAACGTAGLLFSAWFYSVFIGGNYRMAAFATVVSYGLAAVLSLGIEEVHDNSKEERQTVKTFFLLLWQTLKDYRFLLFLTGVSFYNEASRMITVWLNQNQYVRCGMSESMIGWAYMAVTIISLISVFSAKITKAVGRFRFAALLFFLTAAASIVLAYTRSAELSFLCIAAVSASGALLSPLFSELYNRRIIVGNRATQLSIFAVLGDIVAAGANVIYGKAADLSLKTAFLLSVGACIAACITFLICYRGENGKKEAPVSQPALLHVDKENPDVYNEE